MTTPTEMGITGLDPDPAKTAVHLILQDLLENQERLERQERQRRQGRPEPSARPDEPAPAQRNEAATGTGAPDASTSTDTEKLIAYLIQKLLERIAPSGQPSAGQHEAGHQPAPVQPPEPFAPLYADENKGMAASVAQAVKAVLAEHPALEKMYRDGQLPATQRLVEHAQQATSQRSSTAMAAALTPPESVVASAPAVGGEVSEQEAEEDLEDARPSPRVAAASSTAPGARPRTHSAVTSLPTPPAPHSSAQQATTQQR